MKNIVLFRKDIPPKKRRVYSIFSVFFIICVLAVIFPFYAVANRVTPYIMGMPFSMAWIVIWIILLFIGLVLLYAWESRTGGV